MKLRHIAALSILAFPFTVQGESIEDFLASSLHNKLVETSFHPQAKYVIRLGDSEYAMNREQLVAYFKEARVAGTKSKIIDFKVLSVFETQGIVSVVSQAKVEQTIGTTVITGEAISHDILKRDENTFISVFNYTKQ